ncbi:MAG: hypothetical protein HYY45_16445 [Deltaproteobacteria bacterium]|nr:hypothetical protein [Deltaproteobacteria bacterium]
MKRLRILCVVIFWGLSSGCTKFPIVGSYYYKDALIGTADYNLFSGTSHIRVGDRARKVRCEGDSYGTYAPLFTLSGAGHGGEAELRCSDGRIFRIQWATLSWATGYGVGRDQHGDRITLVYGMSEEEAENFLLKELPVILKRSD